MTPFSDDLFLAGRLSLRQPLSGHRVGTDALLAASIAPAAGRVCDLGSGVGIIGLALLMAGAQEAVLVERDPVFAACAQHNISRLAEAMAQRNFGQEGVGQSCASLIEVDLFNRKAILAEPLLADQGFDAVVTNPPYDQSLRGRQSPRPLRQTAHAMEGGSLVDWLKVATRLLKHGGSLCLIHRADAVADVLQALPSRLGGVALRFVHPREGEAASRLLLTATAGSRAAMTVLSPVILHGPDGSFTPEARAIHEGRARLRMQPGPLLDVC